MKALVLMQSINQHYVDTIIEAMPRGTEVILLTGTKDIKVCAPHQVIYTSSHSPNTFISRLKSWMSFSIDVRKWYRNNKKLNIKLIYAVSNPPINSFLGVWLKKKYDAKFIYMEWDIYPQIIEQSFSNKLVKMICSVWHRKNDKIMPQIDKLITIADGMNKSIVLPLSHKVSTKVIPIYTDTERMVPIKHEENQFVLSNGLVGKFVVIYSGKMGYGHNISLILEAAEIIETSYENIVFLMIGNGPGSKIVQEKICSGAKNIKYLPIQPEDIFPFSMASGSIGIVSEESRLAKLFMPSKSYDMMACGLPIIGICTQDDDLYNLINKYRVGSSITDNKAETVATAIIELYKNKELLDDLSKNARKTAVEHYSKSTVLKEYKKLFDEVFE